ncbi:hypothetical protein PG988_005618 [Apiospora saccharicola]
MEPVQQVAFYFCWNLTLVLLATIPATIPVAVVVLGFLSREIEPAIRAQHLALAAALSYVSSTLPSTLVVVAGLGHLPWEYQVVELLIQQSNDWRRLAVAFQRAIYGRTCFWPAVRLGATQGATVADKKQAAASIDIQLPDESSREEEDSEENGDVTMTEEEDSSGAKSDDQEEPGQVENDSLSKEYYKYRVQMLEERLADYQDRLDKKDARHAREIADIHAVSHSSKMCSKGTRMPDLILLSTPLPRA